MIITFSSSRRNFKHDYTCFIKDRLRRKSNQFCQKQTSEKEHRKTSGNNQCWPEVAGVIKGNITNSNKTKQKNHNSLGTFNTLKKPSGSGKPTTVKFFWCYRGHWSSLDSSWVLTGSCCLSITRLCICLQQLRQPQDFTVTVKSVWIQTPAQNKKHPQTPI